MFINKIKRKLFNYRSRNIDNQLWNRKFREDVKKYLNIEVGIGSYGYLKFPAGTKIGNYCSIAEGVRYLAGNHPISNVSTAACFFNPVLGFVGKDFDIERKKLSIGNDVWIGQNVLITNGCTNIGNGSVIGAGSVVTKDVPSYSIVVGNPARILRMRFNEKIIELLEYSKWYDLPIEDLIPFVKEMNDPELFAKHIIQKKEGRG